MSCGIMVLESGGRYSVLIIAHDKMFYDLKRILEGEGRQIKYGMKYVDGKKGISDEDIRGYSSGIGDLVKDANKDPDYDLRKELKCVFSD